MKNINELIFRVNNNLRNNRQVEKDDIKKLLAIAMKMEKQFAISSVSKSLRDKEQFIELAKMIEIHIQKSVDYQASIGTGYFTERFNEVYKNYLESNVC